MATPTKRSHIKRSMAHGIDTALDGGEESDYTFVCNALRGKPRHTALVASWLRDGELDAALRRRDLRGIQLVLGPALPAKCKKMRHLPPRVLRRLFYQAVGAVDQAFEPGDVDPHRLHHAGPAHNALGLAVWS
jgi:hypothetical protein